MTENVINGSIRSMGEVIAYGSVDEATEEDVVFFGDVLVKGEITQGSDRKLNEVLYAKGRIIATGNITSEVGFFKEDKRIL